MPSVFDLPPDWLVIKIANVSRLALVTVIYNRELNIDFVHLKVGYE